LEYSNSIPFTDNRRKIIQDQFNICRGIFRHPDDLEENKIGYELAKLSNQLGENIGYDAPAAYLNIFNGPRYLVLFEPIFLIRMGEIQKAQFSLSRILKDEKLNEEDYGKTLQEEIARFLPELEAR